MTTLAILPVKGFGRAKQRLSPGLVPDTRARLAEAMVGDVLEALAATAEVHATVVVTGEPRVGALAAEVGATVLDDPLEQGQSAAASLGIAHAHALGVRRVLLVPGDCPALDPRELSTLLGAPAPAPHVVIVSDRHGTGTNALLLSPLTVITPSFGPDSFARHRDAAASAGAGCSVARPSSLLLDIDTAADLSVLRARLTDAPADTDRARRTRQALESLVT